MTKLRAVLLLFPLAFAFGVSWHLFSVSAQTRGLRVEGLSVTSSDIGSSHQVTVTFRILNDGDAVTTPFRTTVAVEPAVESPVASVATSSLRSGGTLYVSQTFTVPATASDVDVRVEADVDNALPGGRSQLVVVGHQPVGPPVPGRWFPIGPYHVVAPAASGYGEYHAVGRLGPIAVHPSNPQIIYVGSAGQLGREGCGVWKTTNGGISWIPITDGLPSLAIAAIAIDPTSPNRVYIALVGTGVFRSEDGGTSWALLSDQPSVKRVRRNSFDGDLTVLLVDPNHPATLYLTSDSGILRSDDGGSNWQTSLNGQATALVMDPFDSNLLYAAIQGIGVFRTTDGGKLGWFPQTLPGASNLAPYHGIRLALAHPPTALHEIVYALIGSETDPSGYRLYRSRDGGVTWNGRFKCDTTSSPSGDCEFWVMTADAADTHLYLGGPLFWISTDGGAVFDRMPATGNDRLPASGHGDYHGLALNPIDPSIVFANSDGGIYKSSDHGTEGTWSFIGAGIANAEMYDLAVAPTLPGRLIAGTQDNGTIEYNGSVTWDHIFPAPPSPFGGDGGVVAIDPVDPDVFYNTEQDQQSLRRSADGGQSWSDFKNGLPLKPGVVCTPFLFFGTLLFHFQVHPNNSNVLVASCLALWRTTTTTPSADWKFRFAAPPGMIVRSAIGPGDVYYAGTAGIGGIGGGEVHTAIGGVNWQTIFTHPQALDVSDIEIDPARPELVYVSFAPGPGQFRDCSNGTPLPDGAFANGTGEGRIYLLMRGLSRGAPVSVDLTSDTVAGLPLNLCVAAIAIDPVIPRTIYAGTNRGVYRGHATTGSSVWTWTPYNSGFPLAGPDVRDLEIHPTTRRMIAATFGRGAFEVILHGLERLPF